MKRIINMGKDVYKVCCNICACEFVYDEKEVDNEEVTLPDGSPGLKRYVTCSCCGVLIEHSSLNKVYCIRVKEQTK